MNFFDYIPEQFKTIYPNDKSSTSLDDELKDESKLVYSVVFVYPYTINMEAPFSMLKLKFEVF